MSATHTTRTLGACLLAGLAAFSASGCFGGVKGADKQPAVEGIAVPLAGLDYNVYITRELNPHDAEDRAYYQGPVEDPKCEAAPGTPTSFTPTERVQKCPTNLYGVFVQVCNEDGGTKNPAREQPADFEVEDSQGNKFEPLPLPASNAFAYRARPLTKDDCIPEKGSAAAEGPIAGAGLVFRLPVAATENRPLELLVHAGGETKRFELDI
jgi:hypothetical protein